MSKPKSGRYVLGLLAGFMSCQLACLNHQQVKPNSPVDSVQSATETQKADYRVFDIIRLSDPDPALSGTTCCLSKGQSLLLKQLVWGGFAFRSPNRPAVVKYVTRRGLPATNKDVDGADDRAPYHEFSIETPSKEYPLELSLKYVVGTSKSKEPIAQILDKITIQKRRETHVLRSDDGQWMLLFEWMDEEPTP